MRDNQTTERTVKIELLSQWKLEAEFRKIKSSQASGSWSKKNCIAAPSYHPKHPVQSECSCKSCVKQTGGRERKSSTYTKHHLTQLIQAKYPTY